MITENYELLRTIADKDVTILEYKGKSYGSSWRKRGGVGAFMMLARKWDRVENQMEAAGYDIFEPLQKEMVAGTTDGLLDDIRDLRRYLLLVEGHVMNSMTLPRPSDHIHPNGTGEDRVKEILRGALQGLTPDTEEGEPGPGYVCQDPMWLDSTNPAQPRQA